MRVDNVRTLEDGSQEFDICLTDEERKTIKEAKGWKRLTDKRLKAWFLETIKNTQEHEKER